MSAALAQFHFLRPWWLLLLAVLPWLLWQAARRASGEQALARLVDAALLPALLAGRPGRQRLPLALLALAWAIATLALAGPAWSRVGQPLYARRAAQVVAISLSQRMLARDVAPSRIDRARFKAHDLMMANRDGMNALIGYAGEAFVVAPLTADVHSLDTLLDAMAPDTMPVDGEDAAAAIARGVKLMRGAGTDGGSLVLIADSAGEGAREAARQALAAGVHVSVLGVGTPQGAPVPLPGGGFLHDAKGHLQLAGRDDAALAAVASAGGGRYVPMSADGSDVAALKGELRAGAIHAAHGGPGDAWQDRGPWLLLLLLPLAALAFRRGWLMLLPLVLLPLLPAPAHAMDWRDLWQRRDQQAAGALRQGDAKQAMRLAQDPAWRGAAAYRAGDYAAAVRALQAAQGTDAAYNRGNALAREGKYADAIQAYDEALKDDPRNADAKANRQAVEDWLRRQQKPPQPSSSSSGGASGAGGQGKGADQHQAGKPGEHAQDGNAASQGNGEGKSADAPAAAASAATPPPPAPAASSVTPSSSAAGPGNGVANQGNAQPNPRQQGKDQPGKGGQDKGRSTPLTPAQQAALQAQAARAQQALKQQLDKQLGAAGGHIGAPPATHQLGTAGSDDAAAKLPADLRQALQRVPDDPGALLRRKFELEYQRRHGGAPDGDGP
jgi:Ca-activated chloride channel family protein